MSDIHARTSAAFLADAKARCDAAASIPADAAAADQAIAAIEAGLIEGGAIEAATNVNSINRAARTVRNGFRVVARASGNGVAFHIEMMRNGACVSDRGRWPSYEAALGAMTALQDAAPAMVPMPAQQQQGQAASVYIETRTLAGDVIRRHGPFARDSRPYRDTWHAEHCACEGHNRSRRHDDRSAQCVHVVDAAAR